jgi:hypothetical protein
MGILFRWLLIRIGLLTRSVYQLRFIWILFLAIFTGGDWSILWSGKDWWQVGLNVVFLALDIYTIFILIKFTFRFFHRRREFKKLVHLKILLPRNDSKLDNEKRTEKDFHEQIGKAEQFFRAIHETRDLNLYNVLIKRIIWGKPLISFEFQFEKRQLCFVIVCDTYYQKIIEKQVTTFYESAEIEEVPSEKQFKPEVEGSVCNGS